MNIFYLSHKPKLCAKYHNNRHCVKMIVETAQLLSMAHHLLDGPSPKLYKPVNPKHPCVIWVSSSLGNYQWLYQLFLALCAEYTFRYGKTHKTEIKLKEALSVPPKNIPKSDFFMPPQVMPESHRNQNTIKAYRQYYMMEKAHLADWGRRGKPSWYRAVK